MANPKPGESRNGAAQPPDELRRRAEKLLADGATHVVDLATDDLQALVHELHVYQIELEIQNEELRRTQVELARARDRYADLYEFAPSGYLSLDAHRVIREVNLTTAGMLQVERQELLGKRLEEFVAPDDQDTCYGHFRAVLSSGAPQTWEASLRRPDGSTFCARLDTVPIENEEEGRVGCRVTLSDVTEQRRAEEARHQSEERLRLALEAGQMGTWDWDPVTDQAEWNGRLYELLGLDPNRGPIRGETFFEHVHPEDLPRFRERVEEAIRSNTDFVDEFRIRREDGQLRWLAARGRLVRDAAGRPGRMSGVNYDITERRRADEELRNLNLLLWQRVAERTSALALIRDVASMANRAQSVEEAFHYCLRRVAEHNAWCCGHAFFPAADDPDRLLLAYHWCTQPEADCRRCREKLQEARMEKGKGLPGRVFASGLPEWTSDLAEESRIRGVDLGGDLGLRMAGAFPVLLGNRTVAVLEFFSQQEIPPDEQVRESMASVAAQLSRVVERKMLQDRLLTIADEEQRRIGQDLHDDVGQELVALALKVETLAETLAAREGPERQFAGEILAALDRVRRTIRELSRSLVPVNIDPSGLEGALEELAFRTGRSLRVDCTFTCDDRGQVGDARHATQLYRIAQEAVTNAVRHAKAAHVRLAIHRDGEASVLSIEDDGRGFSPESGKGEGIGLRNMRDRAAFIGAELRVGPAPSGGTLVTCRLPASPAPMIERSDGDSLRP